MILIMNDVYIVDGSRTPFLKVSGKVSPLSAVEMALAAAKPLLARQPFSAMQIDEVITGCVMPSSDEANIARIIALRLGCGDKVPGWTVQRNCASGLQAIDCGFKDIACGRHGLVLVGGVEVMSRAPVLYNNQFLDWMYTLRSSKSFTQKLQAILKVRPSFFKPIIGLLQGLTDPVVGLNMGETAEKLATEFGITREEMDSYAVQSHQRAFNAFSNPNLEVETLYDWQGNVFTMDTGIREDSSAEKLQKLKPVFVKPYGSVTAGNSSQLSDGAAFLLLANKATVDKYNLHMLGKIVDTSWSGLEPSMMGLGPAYSIAKLAATNKLTKDDIDYWEINEAFAVQTIACIKALASKDFCQNKLKLPQAFGSIDMKKLNVDGGAIAIGHPVGASGARVVLHLLHVLQRNNAKRGIASLCIGGGQGGAMLIERGPSNA